MKFLIQDFFSKYGFSKFSTDLVILTAEILDGKLCFFNKKQFSQFFDQSQK